MPQQKIPNGDQKQSESINPDFKARRSSLLSPEEYISEIKKGNRTHLSQAITLLENRRDEYRSTGQKVLEGLMDRTGYSIRIGITGVPGVGKSTFIETLGKMLIRNNRKIAVLTIDPSSSRTGGSILGDKTRMPFLSSHDNAYVRPSPTSGTLGGVTRKTRETLLLCEAAGYDTIFIETVGVGQSETVVKSMVDFFLLLMLSGAGDDLQGIKRGIMEMADMIAINKADGENKKTAKRAALEYRNALSLFPPGESGWKPPVVTCSAEKETGIPELWEKVDEFINNVKSSGYFEKNRREQSLHWFHETIENRLKEHFYGSKQIKKRLPDIENKIKQGAVSPFQAAAELINRFKI